MDDQKQLLLFPFSIPNNDGNLIKHIKLAADSRNRNGALITGALAEISARNIKQLSVGPTHVAFLFEGGRIARLKYNLSSGSADGDSPEKSDGKGGGGGGSGPGAGTTGTNAPTGGSTATSQGASASAGNAASSASILNRSAKIRRVMMSARRTAGALPERAGVIVDRSRSLVPASAIPEELIGQAQVVLQGKSREVIVRELQRTNLNVNEAVNNLLSRDDDDGDDMDDSAEAYLPEELLSLLDAGLRSDSHAAALIDSETFFAGGEGIDYMVARDIARKKLEKEKKAEKKETPAESIMKLKYDEKLQYWAKEKDIFPTGVTKFVKIVSTHSELIALADNGYFYSWLWNNDDHGSMTAHHHCIKLLANAPSDEKFVEIAACAYRVCVSTNNNRVASFVDSGAFGVKLSNYLLIPLMELPDEEKCAQLYACPFFCVVRTQANNLHWCGTYPLKERTRMWEKTQSKTVRNSKVASQEVVEGCEVRTKSHPFYSAGSVAINFSYSMPLVGTLIESAWTVAEVCRFQVMTPAQFDEANADDGSCLTSSAHNPADRNALLNQYGKRPRDETKSSPYREMIWSLKEVVFVHKESSQESAIVKIVDGSYCGIVYKPISSSQESTNNPTGEVTNLGEIRLVKKDDLVVISALNKPPRYVDCFQKKLQKINLPSGISFRKLYSIAVDATGLRLLIEKRGRLHIARISVFGKLQSDHVLPVNSNAVCTNGVVDAQILNYGDEGITILSDSNGSLLPLARDAAGGFREPAFLGLPHTEYIAVGTRPSELMDLQQNILKPVDDLKMRKENRLGIVVALVAPSPVCIRPRFPSLMQAVLYCDVNGVGNILDTLRRENDPIALSDEVISARADGNRTILHAAVMNAFATLNKDDVDTMEILVGNEQPPHQVYLDVDMTVAEEVRAKYDDRWQRLLRRRPTISDQMLINELIGSSQLRRPGHELGNVEEVWADIAKKLEEAKKMPVLTENIKDDASMPIMLSPQSESKKRQSNAIEIVKLLCNHPAVSKCIDELLVTRDINGLTPFMCAINVRAYTAAYVIWLSIMKIFNQPHENPLYKVDDLNVMIFPLGSRVNDSPLFILCANDTCSFTWTGDEHINQDIFECRTCGLVGTLCCCTECAFTCHRNHECKLKRTSPTAYCDCWEKCSCKALVAGNTNRRTLLLDALIQHTSLINEMNSRGEHLLLFLTRTVGRQIAEQEYFYRRIQSKKTQPSDATPEHDLEPPRFARSALTKLLADWKSVKSLMKMGVKEMESEALIMEEVFHLNQQHGCSHLDKFVFTLIAKCSETHVDTLLNTFITEANREGGERDREVDFLISRFLRSVIRLFNLLLVIKPSAIKTATASTAGIAQSTTPSSVPPSRRIFGSGIHTVSFTGLISLVRSSTERDHPLNEETKKKSVTNFVLKSRRVFQTLITYALNELCNMADAIVAPLRLGVVKPTAGIPHTSGDIIDIIEKYLATESEFSLMNATEEIALNKSIRKKRGSRRETDRGHDEARDINISVQIPPGDSDSDNSSDSDSEGSYVFRSQSFVGDFYNTFRNEGQSIHDDMDSSSDVEEDSIDSVNSPVDPDDDTASQGNEGNGNEDDDDDNDGGEEAEGDSEVVVEFDNQHSRDNHEDNGENAFSNEIQYYDDGGEAPYASDDNGENAEPNEEAEERVEQIRHDDINQHAQSRSNRNAARQSSRHVNADGDLAGYQEDFEEHELMPETGMRPRLFSVRQPIVIPEPVVVRRLDTQDSRGNQNQQDVEGNQGRESRRINTANASTGASQANPSSISARTTEQRNSSTNASGVRRSSSKHLHDAATNDESSASITKTNTQLAMSFSVVVKLIVDLMPMLVDHREYATSTYSHIPKMLNIDDKMVIAIRRLIDERLSSAWCWMEIVMDRTEAQLRFGNALLSSPRISSTVQNDKRFSEKKKDDRETSGRNARGGNQISAADARSENSTIDGNIVNKKDESTDTARDDTFNYMMSVMRSHAAENGDDLPIIEYNALKPIAFVIDAYLSLIDMLQKIDTRIASNLAEPGNEEAIDMFQEEDAESARNVAVSYRKFFQRSNSLLYPGIAVASSAHPFEYKCEESLPLAEYPQLLRPGIEKEEMFGLPVKQLTQSAHRISAHERGCPYPAHQSLAEPWTSYQDSSSRTKTTKGSVPATVQPSTSTTEGVLRPNVIVHSKALAASALTGQEPQSSSAASEPKVMPPQGFTAVHLESLMSALHDRNQSHLHQTLARWKHTLNLMAKAYNKQLLVACGGELTNSLLLNEMADFTLKETQFRKKMDYLRSMQTRDLSIDVDRDKEEMIAQTLRQLNATYNRRISASSSNSQQPSSGNTSRDSSAFARSIRLLNISWANSSNNSESEFPPLACSRVKVKFKNEPGEGSGVARSFYAAIADAFLTMKSLPSESQVVLAFSSTPAESLIAPRSASRRISRGRGAAALANLSVSARRRSLRGRYELSVASTPYYSRRHPQLNEDDVPLEALNHPPAAPRDPEREALSDRLLLRVRTIRPNMFNKITGMLLDLQPSQLITIIGNEELLRTLIDEAAELIFASAIDRDSSDAPSVEASNQNQVVNAPAITRAASTPNIPANMEQSSPGPVDDNAPLFYRPNRRSGYYTPIAGKNSPHRLNAFRNVGRMIGICLLQLEIFPMHLCRHVFKFILGRPINWYDMAFYDPELFESLRTLIFDENPTNPDQINSLFLNFEVILPEEEGGGQLDLKPTGANVMVTHENVVEYIYLFVEARMLGNHLKCLEAIKQGVYDVIPQGSLANLTAEDFRLLLCGVQEVSISLMQSYTTFLDESKASDDLLNKFKTWFWSICNKMTSQEKQDLIFFWTGSPTLPPSEEGFQPLPTVLIRPHDDMKLPTANTCISRLYLPLYTSKKVLKAKLLTAIKFKDFGFV